MPPTITSANFLSSTITRASLVRRLFPVAVLGAEGCSR
jgi:hypothetical protein